MYDTSLKRKWDNEAVMEYARRESKAEGKAEGIAEGMEKGMEKGKAEGKAEVVRNLIIKLGFTDAQAADVAEVSLDFVKKVRASLKEE
ncbi:hypothetical protein A9P82_06005 [Arachidicoccus ginsenosidimutans]|uniref:hypothetical protein n=1 Tax=Arachidicoccus sp. BS20 TaxID=1850526 RepID=UPI0007F0D09E|nr:hypothetical protein [Arachidicoccus sp. BS20]ANI88885.1 hypothetical protein A9P82_06005 [Arachidicoccus sp. BS20]